MDSILTSIKKLSGVSKDCPHFDDQIVAYINSVFLVLRQLGVGPDAGFVISDESAIWSDFIPDDIVLRESVKSYISAKVRVQFDPPSNSAHLQALTNTINEFEWRLNVEAESSGISQTVHNDLLLRDHASGVTHKLYVENKQLKMSDEGV